MSLNRAHQKIYRPRLLRSAEGILLLICALLLLCSITSQAAPPWTYSGNTGSAAWSIPASYPGNQYAPNDVSFPMDAVLSEDPAQVTLRIFSRVNDTAAYNASLAGTYDIFRKLANWSTLTTEEVSSTPGTPTTGLRTVIVRDTVPIPDLDGARFIQLEVTPPESNSHRISPKPQRGLLDWLRVAT